MGVHWNVRRTKPEKALVAGTYVIMLGSVCVYKMGKISMGIMEIPLFLAAAGFFFLTAKAAFRQGDKGVAIIALAFGILSCVLAFSDV